MFSFLRSASKPVAVTARQIGVDWGIETVVAVLLDADGNPLDLRQMDAPPEEPGEYFRGLDGLLADWPVGESHMVVSLTRDYHIATLELTDPSPETIVEKVANQLHYESDEAAVAWWKLDSNRVVTITYPAPLLHELTELFGPLGARSVHFEAIELAQARMLQKMSLPLGIVTVHHDLIQFSLFSMADFESLTQSTAVLGIEQMVTIGLDRWKQRGQEAPKKLLTNLSPDYLERLTNFTCERLEEEAVAFHLALSPAGPHRFEARTPASA